MVVSEAEAIWSTIQEFVRGLQRRDPTVRRWIAPHSEAALLLDIYGEEGLLILLKDYLSYERFIFLRTGALPRERETIRLAEIAWVGEEKRPPTHQQRVTLQLRRVRRRWLVQDLWPSPLDEPLTVEAARRAWTEQSELADPAARFLAGAIEAPPEGCGELDDVETLLALNMDAHGYSPREVVRAVRLWRDYGQKARPAYHRPAIAAAAIEYAINLLGGHGLSQQRIAADYGVRPRSLGRRFAEIHDCLRLVCFDRRYAVRSPPPALLERWRAAGLSSPPPLRRGPDNPPCRG